jgi:hypothetical protein
MDRALITIGIRLLEAIFAFGILGSAIVIVVAGIEDVVEIFRPEEPNLERKN